MVLAALWPAANAQDPTLGAQPYVVHIPLFGQGNLPYAVYVPLYAGSPPGAAAEVIAPSSGGAMAQAPPQRSASFVTRNGPNLQLDGQPYTFTGTNAVYLAGPFFPEDKVEEILARLHAAGVDAVRVWVEPWCDLNRVARLLDLGSKYDLRFILTFQDFFGELDGNWFRGRYESVDLPHIRSVVPLFANRPEVLMWELMNEPTCPASDAGADCWEALVRWAEVTSQEIKRLDSNHLVSVGTLSAGFDDSSREAFRQMHALPTIDAVSVHRRAGNLPEVELAIASELDRPVYFGEIYVLGHDESCQPLPNGALEQRAEVIAADIQLSHEAGVDGYLLWQYAYGGVDMGTHTEYFCGVFEYYGDDPVWDVIRSLR
jgi:hypothetical protein